MVLELLDLKQLITDCSGLLDVTEFTPPNYSQVYPCYFVLERAIIPLPSQVTIVYGQKVLSLRLLPFILSS